MAISILELTYLQMFSLAEIHGRLLCPQAGNLFPLSFCLYTCPRELWVCIVHVGVHASVHMCMHVVGGRSRKLIAMPLFSLSTQCSVGAVLHELEHTSALRENSKLIFSNFYFFPSQCLVFYGFARSNVGCKSFVCGRALYAYCGMSRLVGL